MTTTAPSIARLRRPRWLRVFRGALTVLALIAIVFAVGPRNTFGPDTPTPRALPPEEIGALVGWLGQQEAAFTDLRPGNAKGIVWFSPVHERTPWSVVYLHGFSASRLETAPLAERVAQALGANLFYTRLAGHGRSSPQAMGQASVQDWLADAVEALRIGQTLGERVLVIGCSTGATLATWLALSPEGGKVAAHAFISPNFGPRDPRAEIINGPWGQQIALALQGPTRGWTPTEPREANAWTTQYPTRALFPMMAMVRHVREADMTGFQAPVLMLYSEQDQTVDPQQTRAVFGRLSGAHNKLDRVDYSGSRGQHVLAGDIRAPKATAPMSDSIVQWVRTLP